MKIKVVKKSFYGNKVNKIGDIIEFSEKKCPSWGEVISEDKIEMSDPQNDMKIEELSKLNEDEIKEILDNLLNEAIDKGIMIDFENKSDIALILELTELLKGKE